MKFRARQFDYFAEAVQETAKAERGQASPVFLFQDEQRGHSNDAESTQRSSAVLSSEAWDPPCKSLIKTAYNWNDGAIECNLATRYMVRSIENQKQDDELVLHTVPHEAESHENDVIMLRSKSAANMYPTAVFKIRKMVRFIREFSYITISPWNAGTLESGSRQLKTFKLLWPTRNSHSPILTMAMETEMSVQSLSSAGASNASPVHNTQTHSANPFGLIQLSQDATHSTERSICVKQVSSKSRCSGHDELVSCCAIAIDLACALLKHQAIENFKETTDEPDFLPTATQDKESTGRQKQQNHVSFDGNRGESQTTADKSNEPAAQKQRLVGSPQRVPLICHKNQEGESGVKRRSPMEVGVSFAGGVQIPEEDHPKSYRGNQELSIKKQRLDGSSNRSASIERQHKKEETGDCAVERQKQRKKEQRRRKRREKRKHKEDKKQRAMDSKSCEQDRSKSARNLNEQTMKVNCVPVQNISSSLPIRTNRLNELQGSAGRTIDASSSEVLNNQRTGQENVSRAPSGVFNLRQLSQPLPTVNKHALAEPSTTRSAAPCKTPAEHRRPRNMADTSRMHVQQHVAHSKITHPCITIGQSSRAQSKAVDMSSLEPLNVLCSESFLESWGTCVAELASGRWACSGVEVDFSDPTRSGHLPGRRIAFIDTPLVDACGVDIEIHGRSACRIYASTRFESADESQRIIVEAAELAAIGRYKNIHIFICYIREITSLATKHLARFQCATALNRYSLTKVSFKTVTPKSLSSTLARTILSHPKIPPGTLQLTPSNATSLRTIECAQFLLSLVPVLNSTGAIHVLHHAEKLLPPNCPYFRLIFQNERLRQRLLQELGSEVHPAAMIQLSHVLHVTIAKDNRSPKKETF